MSVVWVQFPGAGSQCGYEESPVLLTLLKSPGLHYITIGLFQSEDCKRLPVPDLGRL